MQREAKSRDRPARGNYAMLMRHGDVGSAREPPEKPVCTEKPECVGWPFPNHGFVRWGEKCKREKLKEIHREGGKADESKKSIRLVWMGIKGMPPSRMLCCAKMRTASAKLVPRLLYRTSTSVFKAESIRT